MAARLYDPFRPDEAAEMRNGTRVLRAPFGGATPQYRDALNLAHSDLHNWQCAAQLRQISLFVMSW
ncbi:hypothetical protein [Octadecabacter temperatus]|uniref:hypothetical protein n=1 Tax=Octadecabacter temperatus TaxID=1458307 RepID=UPI000676515F|nr:hypothetical protein [Octadecabacter temperatus]